MNTVPPWDEDEVRALNAYQQSGEFHPLTCRYQRADEKHRQYQATYGGDFGQLIATTDGMVCPVCCYVQNWIPEFVATICAALPTKEVSKGQNGEHEHCTGLD